MQTRVVFVRQGTWGITTQEEEDGYLEVIKLSVSIIKNHGPHADMEAAATVETVETSDDARRRLEQGNVDVLVFNSRSHISAARELKRHFPRVKIVVMTGLIPKEEVIIVHKAWIHGEEITRRIFVDHA